MTTRDIARKYEREILEVIPTLQKQDEYFVASYAEISRRTGINQTCVRTAMKKLERKGLIEVKESFALFGTMQKRGFKILGGKND